MTVRLRIPFRSLSADNFISRGSAGHVFAISRDVVFKCPTLFDNPVPAQAEEMVESLKKLENEKAIYRILMENPHPNILCGLLCVPEGIFLHRQETTLETRIERSPMSAISPSTQARWIQQISSGLAWLENLGYAHGDLRPANIFLGTKEEVRLGDFDSTVKRGEQLEVVNEPFCKMNEDYEPPLAGPVSEQFSLASCIYTIRFGHKPFYDLEAPIRVRRLIMNQFPSTKADVIFGDLTQKCWHGGYHSVKAVELEVISLLEKHIGIKGHSGNDRLVLDDMKAQCTAFLEMEARDKMEPIIKYENNLLQYPHWRVGTEILCFQILSSILLRNGYQCIIDTADAVAGWKLFSDGSSHGNDWTLNAGEDGPAPQSTYNGRISPPKRTLVTARSLDYYLQIFSVITQQPLIPNRHRIRSATRVAPPGSPAFRTCDRKCSIQVQSTLAHHAVSV